MCPKTVLDRLRIRRKIGEGGDRKAAENARHFRRFMSVASREHEPGRLAGQGAKCYHFPVRRLLSTLFAALLLASASCKTITQEDDLSDQAVKARIETVLRGRKDLDLKYVTIDVNAGSVSISGLVPNQDQVRIIRRLATNVKGVEQVLNNLVIQE